MAGRPVVRFVSDLSGTLPEVVTVRVVGHTLPGAIMVEAGEGPQGGGNGGTAATSRLPDPRSTALTGNMDVALMGAETALAAFGYRLDLSSIQQESGWLVARFRREPPPEDTRTEGVRAYEDRPGPMQGYRGVYSHLDP